MTDQDLLTELQYALLEPPDGGQSWPSEVWTRAEVLGNVNANLWAWLRATRAVTTRTELAVTAASGGLVTLPSPWLATATAVWRAADGTRTPLGRADRFEGDLAMPTWASTPATPLAFAEGEGDSLTAQLIPAPAADGTLELRYIAQPAALAGADVALPLPALYASAAKYGTLGMLLRKVSRLLDPERAAYCERRYDLTVTLTAILLDGWA